MISVVSRKRWIVRLVVLAVISLGSIDAYAQSNDQSFPTPVRSNEISGTVKARDVGDSRLTTYFYTFEGDQGDLFVNVQTRNFTGDIDVYIASGLRPLTKIVMYADISETETGRVLYLRKPERLIMRIQGRTPGDDDATFRIKFAGGFSASKLEDSQNPEIPKVNTESNSGIKVNSVGTILEVIPKPTPAPKETVAAVESETKEKAEENVVAKKREDDPGEEMRSKPEVVITDPVGAEKKIETTKIPVRTNRRTRTRAPVKPKAEPVADTTPEDLKKEETTTKPEAKKRAIRKTVEPEVDPMANVRLVIYFKDGGTIERPMTDVFKFSIERALLTVISKDGTIGRYKMLEVSRVSIE